MTGESAEKKLRILVLGATGTIGREAVRTFVARGHEVVCFARSQAGDGGRLSQGDSKQLLCGAEVRFGDVTDCESLAKFGFCGQRFDVVVSCLASRTGVPSDAWAIDYQANMNALYLAQELGVTHIVLLSAICVQKPRLEFQYAKLAFEKALLNSGLIYSIVRPTAFFKSLSGQIARLQNDKSFLVFGNGTLTSCKPISNSDLASYLADCFENPSLQNKILPIGGPGPPITPLQQGLYLFELMERKPQFTHVPVKLLSATSTVLGAISNVVPKLKSKAELARIGYYYATESMLLLDKNTGLYDASATPQTGSDTLFDYYQRVIDGEESIELGDHAVF